MKNDSKTTFVVTKANLIRYGFWMGIGMAMAAFVTHMLLDLLSYALTIAVLSGQVV